jgi:hypothetical protein
VGTSPSSFAARRSRSRTEKHPKVAPRLKLGSKATWEHGGALPRRTKDTTTGAVPWAASGSFLSVYCLGADVPVGVSMWTESIRFLQNRCAKFVFPPSAVRSWHPICCFSSFRSLRSVRGSTTSLCAPVRIPGSVVVVTVRMEPEGVVRCGGARRHAMATSPFAITFGNR